MRFDVANGSSLTQAAPGGAISVAAPARYGRAALVTPATGLAAAMPPRSADPTGTPRSDIQRVPQLSLHTPVGDLTISEEHGAIVAIDWGWGRDQEETPLLRVTRDRLDAYFDGAPVLFTDLPLAPAGTPYRRKVWDALCTIPSGETRTYGDIARVAGGSPRSVGSANGANPIPILIPCHRVVAGGGLGGYSGGEGLPTKRFLLGLETRARPLLAHPA